MKATVSGLALLFIVCGCALPGSVGLSPLKCEYRVDPLAVESGSPRLSWVIESGRRGFRQSAYRVLVASSPGALASDEADLWDSGKVESDRSVQVAYEGAPLKSRMRCHWKVRVWDERGVASAWSPPAVWEMGLLEEGDWQAKWIGMKRDPLPVRRHAIKDAQWIWFPEGDNLAALPPGNRCFHREINVDKDLKSAQFLGVGDQKWELYVNGTYLGAGLGAATVVYYDLIHHLKRGANAVAVHVRNPGGGPNPAGLLGAVVLVFTDGSSSTILTDGDWIAGEKPDPGWNQPGFRNDSWKPAKAFGKCGIAPFGDQSVIKQQYPAPYFRREFAVPERPVRARAYVCGLGYYELHLNGARVGDHVLDPGQTDYEKRSFYVAYDVTNRIKRGQNAIGVILGTGWYHQHLVWGGLSYGPPRLILQLEMEYEDGRRRTVVSDGQWRVSTGPIVDDNVYKGETYDARLELERWDEPGYNEVDWGNAIVVDGPGGRLVSQKLPPIRRVETIKPVELTEPRPGVFVYDMGQNFAGWVKLKVRGEKGTKVTLKFSELLYKDGMIDPASTGVFATGYEQTDEYVCRGSGLEVWEPRFTYHGFQFVEMTGYPGKPALDSIEGVAVHTDADVTGHFECSNGLINRIHEMALWTERSNLHGVPTDCPARERCGWLGDAHVTAEMTIYNFDMATFWRKYQEDIVTGLGMGGGTYTGRPATPGIPCNIAPGKRRCGEARPDWGSAVCQIPWYLYLYYGDKRALGENYAHMKRFVDYLAGIAEGNIVSEGYGDWCPPQTGRHTHCPVPLSSTAFYYYDARILAETAKLLGNKADEAKYTQLAGEIKKAIIGKFLDRQKMSYGSQTADVLALFHGLVPDGRESSIAAALARSVVEEHKHHLDTGIHGVRHLYWALANWGHDDAAYRVLTQKTFPSYGYLIDTGATTIHEVFLTEVKPGHQGSLNHPMQGGFDAWFYSGVGGIAVDESSPGFKHVIMRPELVGQLEWAKAGYDSIHGPIRSHWRRSGADFRWNVAVPANTSATIYVPGSDPAAVSEGGVAAGASESVRFVGVEGDSCVFTIGSGSYSFSSALPE